MTLTIKGNMELFGIKNINELSNHDGRLVTLYIDETIHKKEVTLGFKQNRKDEKSPTYKGCLSIVHKFEGKYTKLSGHVYIKTKYYKLHYNKKETEIFSISELNRYFRVHSNVEQMLFKLEYDL